MCPKEKALLENKIKNYELAKRLYNYIKKMLHFTKHDQEKLEGMKKINEGMERIDRILDRLENTKATVTAPCNKCGKPINYKYSPVKNIEQEQEKICTNCGIRSKHYWTFQ